MHARAVGSDRAIRSDSLWFYTEVCADLLRQRYVPALRLQDASAELGDALQLGLGDVLGLDVGGGELQAHGKHAEKEDNGDAIL